MPRPFRVGRSVRFRYDELRAWGERRLPNAGGMDVLARIVETVTPEWFSE